MADLVVPQTPKPLLCPKSALIANGREQLDFIVRGLREPQRVLHQGNGGQLIQPW